MTTSRWQSSHMADGAAIHAHRGATCRHIQAGGTASTHALPKVPTRMQQGTRTSKKALSWLDREAATSKAYQKARITSRQAAACGTPLAFAKAASRSILSTTDVRAGLLPLHPSIRWTFGSYAPAVLAVRRDRRRIALSTVGGRRSSTASEQLPAGDGSSGGLRWLVEHNTNNHGALLYQPRAVPTSRWQSSQNI
jgi:hypothetical protein